MVTMHCRIYSIATGKQKSVVKPPAGEDGSFIKVSITSL